MASSSRGNVGANIWSAIATALGSQQREQAASVQAAEEHLLEIRRGLGLGPGDEVTGSPALVASLEAALKMYVRLTRLGSTQAES